MEVLKTNPLGLSIYKLLIYLYGNHIQSYVLLDLFEITTNHKNHMAPVCPSRHVPVIMLHI